jgi:hypothetical protein
VEWGLEACKLGPGTNNMRISRRMMWDDMRAEGNGAPTRLYTFVVIGFKHCIRTISAGYDH